MNPTPTSQHLQSSLLRRRLLAGVSRSARARDVLPAPQVSPDQELHPSNVATPATADVLAVANGH